jgi:inorganic pyrophosphatase
MPSPNFWKHAETLLAEHPLVIDRPRGSAHPRYPEKVYPLDYGYLDGTSGGDGDGIDVWRGTQGEALVGVLCTVDLGKRDMEIKLLVGCSDAEIELVIAFTAVGTMACTLVRR